jgi:hypothetical protein
MKATDFDLRRDLELDPEAGVATFHNNRVLVMDASALGLLRSTLVNSLGRDRARYLLLQFGYSHGYADFMQMKKRHEFDSDMDLLASGPVIHSWEGLVKATPKELRFDREKQEMHFTGTWENSWEAEQHLCAHEASSDPVCWTLTGYASGWSSAWFGSPLIAIEPHCVGKGDDACGWLIRPLRECGEDAADTVEALRPLLSV